jgi:hypothetical protein
MSHLFDKGYFIDLAESDSEEVSVDEPHEIQDCCEFSASNHDKCTTLNGSNGEFTDKNCVRAECICEACWLDWENSLYVRTLLKTGAIIVCSDYCCICLESDGCDVDLYIGDIYHHTQCLPLWWKLRHDFLQHYYFHHKKALRQTPCVSYSHADFVNGDEELDWSCLRAYLRANDTSSPMEEHGDWDSWVEDSSMDVVESQLNGANGEVTGDDDMPKFITEAAKHQKPVNGGRRDPNDMNAKQRIAHKKRDSVKQVEEKPAQPKILSLVYEHGCQFCIYQKELYVRQQGVAVGPTGQLLPIIESNQLVHNVVDHGYGYVVTQAERGVDCMAVASVQRNITPVACSNSPYEGLLVHPFLSQLKTEFPSATKQVAHARTAAMALCQKHYPTVPSQFMEFTITFFFAEKEMFSVDVERLNTEEGVREAEAYQRLGVVTEYALPWRSYGTDANVAFSWECREDVSLVVDKCKGVKTFFDGYDSLGVEKESEYHVFETTSNANPRFYHTHMFQFTGDDDKRFVAYEPNGHNANLALKRIFGCNDWNDLYMFYQYNLTPAYMSDTNFTDQDVFSLLRVDVTKNYYVVGKGEHVHHVPRLPDSDEIDYPLDPCYEELETGVHNQARAYIQEVSKRTREITGYDGGVDIVELYRKVRSAVQTGRQRLIAKCDQTYLDMFVDTLGNAKEWAYGHCAVAYYRVLDIWHQRNFNVEAIQHHKKALRRAWFKGIQLNQEKDCLVKKIMLNVKKEWAKPGKAGRLFASYNVGGIYAPELPEFVKACIHGAHVFQGPLCDVTIYIMSKAKDDEINQVFQQALEYRENKNHIFYIVYSDDSCMIGNVHGEAIMANMDISSCDASNRFPIFMGIYRLLARFSPDRASALLEQCTKNMVLVNPSNPEEVMEIIFHSCMEGSGTVLTTVLNHTVSYDIGVAVFTCLNEGMEFEHAVKVGALMVGHKLTIDRCEYPEKLQFLKRSPLKMTDGRYHMCINYGTIFRGLGCVEGDLAAIQLGVTATQFNLMSWKEKMERFCTVVVQGLVHEPSSSVMDALRQRFETTPIPWWELGAGCDTLDYFYRFVPRNHGSKLRIDEESLCKRYGLEPYELGILVDQIVHIAVGKSYPSSAVRKFFGLDYSL